MPEIADEVCRFAELNKHEKGKLQGQRFKLEDFQVFIFCSIFGFLDENGIRMTREAFILIPRGNGKSPIAAIIALWMLAFDGEPGAEVYCGAGSEKQALEVFRPAKAMVEQSPELYQRYGIEAAAKSIFQESSRSRFVPIIGKPGDGQSIHCAILDEWHEADDATQYDCFKTGANKRDNSLILEISTAGTTIEGPCHDRQKDGELVLEGTVDNDRLFVLIYGIDPETDWTTHEALVMSNPNLGVSNNEEALLLDQQEAVRNPRKQNIFRTKHQNVWCTELTAWMNAEDWSKCYDPDLTEESVKDLPCWMGADLARSRDLSAVVFLFRREIDGKTHYYCLTRTFLPETRINLPENQHFQGWQKQGWLTSMPGASTDWPFLKSEVLAQARKFSQVRQLAYDEQFNGDEFAQYISDELGIERIPVPPVPKELTPPAQELEAAIDDGRFHHDSNPVLRWCVGNILFTENVATGLYRMPSKKEENNKIDAAVALFYAMSRALRAEPESSGSTMDFW